MNSLLIRADGNDQIGTGHVMRCIALAQAWQETGGDVYFVVGEGSVSLESRIRDEGVNLHIISGQPGSTVDAAQTLALAEAVDSTWIVVDGYQFNADYQQAVKRTGLQLLFIDDYGHADYYSADLILNQNVYAVKDFYNNCSDITQLLLGTRYALLRREFWSWRDWEHKIALKAHKVLVTLGGGDQGNVVLDVVRALKALDDKDLEVVVIVASSSLHLETLIEATEAYGRKFRLESEVIDLPVLMAWADIAVSAGGSTCWELAFMGIPFLVITLAGNQAAVGPGLETAGAAIHLGWHSNATIQQTAGIVESLLSGYARRVKMAHSGQKLVDGYGASRVVQFMQHMHHGGLKLRDVVGEDARLLWDWANNPATRSASFSTAPIPWESHFEWLSQKLVDPNSWFFVAVDSNSRPIGQVRFQVDNDEAVISISLAPKERGHGYGSKIIWLGSQRIFDISSVAVIHAYIRQDNETSIRAFSKAGFIHVGVGEVQGILADHYALKR